MSSSKKRVRFSQTNQYRSFDKTAIIQNNPVLKSFCGKLDQWSKLYESDHMVSTKIEILSSIIFDIVQNPKSIIPDCLQMFKNVKYEEYKYSKVYFEFEPRLKSSLKGKGDAVILLGSLICEYNSDINKLPVAIKIAFKTSEDIPRSERDNSGEIEYEILLKIKDSLLKKQSPNFIFPFIFQECDLNIIFEQDSNLDPKFIESVKPSFIKNQTQNRFSNDTIITVMERGKGTLSDLIMNSIQDENMSWEEFESTIIIPVFFQIGYAFKVLLNLGIVHHDTHMENIFVDSYDELQNIYYMYENKINNIRTRYVPKIFDFDQSYLKGEENLGLRNTALCKIHGICNTFNQKWDLYRFLITFHSTLIYYLDRNPSKSDWADQYMEFITRKNKWVDQDFASKEYSVLYDSAKKRELFNLPDEILISVDNFISSLAPFFENVDSKYLEPNQIVYNFKNQK